MIKYGGGRKHTSVELPFGELLLLLRCSVVCEENEHVVHKERVAVGVIVDSCFCC